MKYCIPYYTLSKYKDIVDEITVLATEKEELGGIKNFMETRPESQRVVFVFRNLYYELGDIDFILLRDTLKDKNYTICWQEASLDVDYHTIADKCVQYNLNFYFENPAYTPDEMYGFADIGVSDIVISGDLGFDTQSLKRLKRRYDVTIRAYPDVCQSKWRSLRPELTFWIRPEDQEQYEGAIDVLQGWMCIRGQVYADLWYDVYAKDKYWYGDLTKLITGLFIDEQRIDSRCFTKDWGEQRSKCGRACLRDSQCVFCREAIKMAQNIKNLGYIIKQPEDEHGKVYYTLLEEFEKASKERRAQIDEDVRKVLSKFNGIEKV